MNGVEDLENHQEKRHFETEWDGTGPLKKNHIGLGRTRASDILVWSSALEYLIRIAGHCILGVSIKTSALVFQIFPEVTVKAENRKKIWLGLI